MPDAGGNIKGIALSGKAGEVLERIFTPKRKARSDCVILCQDCAAAPAIDQINGAYFCYNCWGRLMGLD